MLRACIAAAALTLAASATAQELRKAAPFLLLDEPAPLAAIEAAGHGLAATLGAPQAKSNAAMHTASALWRDMAQKIRADVAELESEIVKSGRKLYKVTDGNVGRIMDLEWLASPIATFSLAAIVNRIDRRDFHELQGESATCGELRLIHRLGYEFEDRVRKRRLASRLPFNLNVVYSITRSDDADCKGAADAFTPGEDIPAARVADWLTKGPLDRARLKLKQIELNAQVVRFPSGQETEFGGQAVYLMRIYGLDGERVIEKTLENTPDIARLESDADARKRLVDYVAQNLPAIDRGVYSLPDDLLAKRAFSFSTYGSARLANHPFTKLLKESDFPAQAFASLDYLRTPRALIERLDNSTCMGCHQANATAGFHVIGRDGPRVPSINRVKVGISPHLHAELPRRRAWVEAVAKGEAPNRFRPLSAAPAANWASGTPAHQPAAAGMPCLPQDQARNFASAWTCAPQTACHVIGRDPKVPLAFGQCVATREEQMFSGHPCLEGDITSNARPWLDRFRIGKQFAAHSKAINDVAFTCRPPKIGVPGGAAYRKCNAADRDFLTFANGKAPAEICGFAGGKAFDDCVATNDFARCLAGSIVRGNRPTCSADRFCREDFMCQELPPDTPHIERVKGFGYCSPTYFLFQMRIDGHPDPRGTIPATAR